VCSVALWRIARRSSGLSCSGSVVFFILVLSEQRENGACVVTDLEQKLHDKGRVFG